MTTDPFIDTHCFAGGLALGVAQSGFELVGKKEGKGAFGAANMEANRHILGDKWQTQADLYENWEPIDARLIVGNPPCSGFSTMSTFDPKLRGPESKLNACMWGITEYAAKVKPEIFVFESVAIAYKDGRGLMQQLRARLEELSGEKYHLTHVLHSARSCGAPQFRQRYFFVAHRVPFGMEAPDTQFLPTMRDTIQDLENLSLSWDDQAFAPDLSMIHPQLQRRHGYRADGMIDGHMTHSTPHTRNMEALANVVDWHEGESNVAALRRAAEQSIAIPDGWQSRAEDLERAGWSTSFDRVRRYKSDGPSPVIVGDSLTMNLHYKLNRTLTHREVARIMGYPDDWRIAPLKGAPQLIRFWGKGVTVDCGRWLGTWLRNSFDGSPGVDTGVEIGDRESLIDYKNWYKTLAA
jgi:site-specific DNA-cytosine methylase